MNKLPLHVHYVYGTYMDTFHHIRVWDAVTGEMKVELKGHSRALTTVAFSPDGATIISGSLDETIR